ncbi:MAG TPA: lipocalin-like domain-containing protein [Stellaceae bacterium]|nr:lipocalin-like domain-containing protein [Stellaceae bacterium]
MKAVVAAASLFLSFVLFLPSSFAETAKDLVGTWKYVVNQTTKQDGSKVETYGKEPKGIIMFDSGGHFMLFIAKPNAMKFASKSRLNGTPEEYKNAVYNSIAYYGTYKVDEPAKILAWSIDAATFPNWYGVTQRRHFSIKGDELRITNRVGSSGGSVLSVLKRLN